MSSMVLATALELARLHGVRCAAFYLVDSGIDVEVAVDLLGNRATPNLPPKVKHWRVNDPSTTARRLDLEQLDARRKVLDLSQKSQTKIMITINEERSMKTVLVVDSTKKHDISLDFGLDKRLYLPVAVQTAKAARTAVNTVQFDMAILGDVPDVEDLRSFLNELKQAIPEVITSR